MTTPTTIPSLADAYGDLTQQIKALEAARDAIKAELAKRKSDTFSGARWTIERTTYDTSRLDSKLIRAEMGEDWIKSFTVTTSATRLTVKPALADATAIAA